MKNLHLFYTSVLKCDETLKDRYDYIMLRNIFVSNYMYFCRPPTPPRIFRIYMDNKTYLVKAKQI